MCFTNSFIFFNKIYNILIINIKSLTEIIDFIENRNFVGKETIFGEFEEFGLCGTGEENGVVFDALVFFGKGEKFGDSFFEGLVEIFLVSLQ